MSSSKKSAPAPVAQPAGEPVAPEGFKLVAVRGFDELVYWLERCDDKGHLENCPNLVQPWAEFDWREIPPAAARVPLTDEQITTIYQQFSTGRLDGFTAACRAIERLHEITS